MQGLKRARFSVKTTSTARHAPAGAPYGALKDDLAAQLPIAVHMHQAWPMSIISLNRTLSRLAH